jgi:hypothetical protein
MRIDDAIESATMQPKDVAPCVALVASHPEERRRYGTLLKHLRPAWVKLIRSQAMQPILIEDTGSRAPDIAGCGASVFVNDQFLARLKADPMVWLGPELVRRALSNDGSILPPKAIREAYSRQGLNVAVWAGTVHPMRPEYSLELMRAFAYQHTGYRLKELVTQPHEFELTRMTINAGTLLWHASEGCYRDGSSEPIEELSAKPFLLGATRALAFENGAIVGSWLSSLFSYEPPRIYFRPAEQRLLLAALRGLTDEDLADELGISLSAVKKTWRSVYRRASQASLPELPLSATAAIETKRGKEKKQPLLEYLRRHMEELRPILPPRSRS